MRSFLAIVLSSAFYAQACDNHATAIVANALKSGPPDTVFVPIEKAGAPATLDADVEQRQKKSPTLHVSQMVDF